MPTTAENQSRFQLSPLSPPLPTKHGRTQWHGLRGDHVALALAQLALSSDGPVIAVVAGMREADALNDTIRFFMGSTPELLPDWETLPYDLYSPHPDIISSRLSALNRLPGMTSGLVIVPAAMLQHFCPPLDYINANVFMIKVGQQFDLSDARMNLEKSGYYCVPQVSEHGEFSVRGSLLDLFPMGADTPYRIDLFDDQIESIRTFDPETQRSLETITEIALLPGAEFSLGPESIRHFRSRYREVFPGDPQNSVIYRDVSAGNSPGGVEYYLPLFFEHPATLFDFVPKNSIFALLPGAEDQFETCVQQFWHRYEERRHDVERPVLEPNHLILDPSDVQDRLNKHTVLEVSGIDAILDDSTQARFEIPASPDVSLQARSKQPAQALLQFTGNFNGKILFTADSIGRVEILREQLAGYGIRTHPVPDWNAFLESDERFLITQSPVESGLHLTDNGLALIPEARLFGERARQKRPAKRARQADAIVRNLTDLVEGAPVVHEDHGVGRYLGLKRLQVGGIDTEYVTIAYSGDDKLYVPVSSLQKISRYTGVGPDNAPLHRLGGEQWQKIRRKAAEKINDVAAELLDLYSRRAARIGQIFDTDNDEYSAFAGAFPFEETEDQSSAIESILEDLASSRPMDRVVCGDVGFGKTEVAMRAAFVVAQSGKQVAVLVPTTLLAQQHYQNFCDRFAPWPIRVEVLSRFRSAKQQSDVLKGLRNGTIDIVIGTHKLLQKDMEFKDLGLVIVDEEHRFGVRQKERLKALRSEVDLLTLTATPIPRTLNMSLSGLRDLSIIATPPVHRLAVKTFVGQWHDATIREACLREIKRGGQIYFLHNEVDSIERVAGQLRALLPEVELGVAHGQMREKELEQIMLDFYHRRFNLLLCTTIIESGIDIPTANTIIMNRADKLGLAQLHQLRGRVGRSHHLAYAYLIVPPRKVMTADAIKRIEAIESLETIGAGFSLASHDLEIRGAGELLGEEQSGQIHEIGYAMYMELLERAVADLKSGRQPALERGLDHGPEIDLHFPALIPDDYLPDIHTRLTLYKRISAADSGEALQDLQIEMIDRFGLLPDPVKNLFEITKLKIGAQPLGILRIDVGETSGKIVFGPDTSVDPGVIVQLIQTRPDQFSMQGDNTLRFSSDMPEFVDRTVSVFSLLDKLSSRN